ncbi:acylneuraminate cytidylyltransferase family protein [Campylobacter jejuni]|uniref:acylneuraminate cytidylyltransferase family protein n=1 Tax=Campylobacter jejuni TaxID=197 RepID=UPI001285358F|nr:acylneuraminate cytidylyltransferase family protein [Campylobacter jejuni]EAJ3987149.1 acylneuraminate cytidylyltransferase family protein [Campylobacter jejuni]EAJ4800748.1 acylneuraminate cytidylyltransferase family protein [Campylobacter jejuni]EAJ7444230.1 acylneuraminate cytidylyltransferase family protein [Campylobacter jejuni]EAJ7916641.1 acylneuraminate cytidylyltransferase family protein [Campylobacter jejuni]
MKFTAVIPVKANSSRLPGKNIKPFGNENLLTRKIRQVKASNIADRIIVSSDSDEMLQMARDMGVEAIKRPVEFANESRPLGDFFDYITSLILDGHLIWACATSPFFDENLMINAKKEYLKALKNGYDSLITIYKFKHYMLDEKGPLNYKLGLAHQNSQDLPALDFFTNGILFAPIEFVKKWHYNYGPKAYRFEVNQKASIDIDTKYDYLAALSWLDEDNFMRGGGISINV